MVPLYRKARDRTKQIGFAAMPRQMLDRLIDEEPGLLARPLLAEQRYEGRLAGPRILARRLASGRFIAAVVDQVVRDLEGEADVARIAAVRPPRFGRKLGHDAPGFDGIFDEGT